MTGIAGWSGFQAEDNPELIAGMGALLSRFDNSRVSAVVGERCALCVSSLPGGMADAVRADGMLAAIQGVFRWADDRLDVIAREQGASRALLEGYSSLGTGVTAMLKGRFSLAIVDEGSGFLLAATDRTGSSPLVYSSCGDALVFGSSSDVVNVHPACVAEVDPQAVFNYLYFHVVPGPGCIYKGHARLAPGQMLRFENGRADVSSYWQLQYREHAPGGFDELKDEFLSILESSVRAVSDSDRTGTFLSGGTDSSTVTGMLGEVLQRDVPAFSIGFTAEGYDEMEYARIAAGKFRVEHHEYYVTPEDVVEAIPRVAAVYSEPFGNASAVPAYYCAQLAADDGVTRMLAGDGGDELFAGNGHYARQMLFAYYDAVPAVLRRRMIEPLVMSRLFSDRIMPLRKIRRYVEQARLPMPARMESYNLLHLLGIGNVVDPDFLAGIEPADPERIMQERYDDAHADSMLNRMLWLDYKFILADKDLPKVSRMCELAGVEVTYPLLSDELVEFAARIPVPYKLKGQKLRYLFKEALRGFLPDEIITKQKHGFGLPTGVWIASHDRLGEMARDSLSDLKSRRIVRNDMIDSLLDSRLGEHAHYYGNMVWVLMMLEQWYRTRPGGISG